MTLICPDDEGSTSVRNIDERLADCVVTSQKTVMFRDAFTFEVFLFLLEMFLLLQISNITSRR
jgi:hypothetical protein